MYQAQIIQLTLTQHLIKKNIFYNIDTWIEEELFAKVPDLVDRSLLLPLEKKLEMIY
jgi:hypothetical protein